MPNKYLDSVGLAEYTSLVKTALSGKADVSSPALTGTPTAPTPTAGDDSTKIATTEFVQDAIDAEETRADGAYLPLTGGSVTGNLTVSGTITGNVTGNVTGTASGNLPLSGGTMTGDIVRTAGTFAKVSADDGYIQLYGGTGYDHGAWFQLCGKDHSNTGRWSLQANNGTNKVALVGNADGTLTWNGNNVITSAGGTMTGPISTSYSQAFRKTNSNDYIQINSGVATADGSSLVMCAKDYSGGLGAGAFNLTARDSNEYKILYGKPDGTLTWGGKEVERIQASGTNYIRFVSGLQICWGSGTTANPPASVNFPVSFSAQPGIAFVHISTVSTGISYQKMANVTTTAFTPILLNASHSDYVATSYRYIAIGKWK